MQIKRKVFSYPVLNHDCYLSTFNNKEFDLNYELKEDENDLIIGNLRFECNSDFVNEKINCGLIKALCIVECSDTIFRKKYEISKEESCIKIAKENLANKVEVSIFAYASSDFLMQTSNDFDVDYQGIDFQIEKNNIICVNDGIVFGVIHEEEKTNLVKSIFSIIPIDDKKTNTFDVAVDINKIEISMSRDNWLKYRNVYQTDVLTEEFFCVLLIPALTEALFKCKELVNNNEVEDVEDIEQNFNWFRSITYAYKNLTGKDLELSEFIKISPLTLAQDLLGAPLKKALETIENNQSYCEVDNYE